MNFIRLVSRFLATQIRFEKSRLLSFKETLILLSKALLIIGFLYYLLFVFSEIAHERKHMEMQMEILTDRVTELEKKTTRIEDEHLLQKTKNPDKPEQK